MWQQQKTAEDRLYKWLKRKTTPAEAWKEMTQAELAAIVRTSKSQICRVLPKVVAKLNDIPIDEAKKLVSDLMAVRRGHLLNFEVEMIIELRSLKKPASVSWIASQICVSEKQVRAVCKRFGVDGVRGYSYWHSDLTDLLPEGFNQREQLNENIRIREKLSEKHRKIGNVLRFRHVYRNLLESSYD